jgi:hypothetical protein
MEVLTNQNSTFADFTKPDTATGLMTALLSATM